MASITSMVNGSSSVTSIYGNRNVISGLASGMDTESMIENAVSGIKLKIQNLQKRRTKVEWQQEAYRSIIDKAVNFNQKYTSYTSKTNLLSSSFFNNAVNTAALGTYKDKVTASGKTTSDIRINAVKQLAKAATYTVSGLGGRYSGEIASAEAGKAMDIKGDMTVSNVSGTLSFQYGGTNGTSFDISFDELEDLTEGMEGKSHVEQLAAAIEKKLSEITYNYTKNGVSESTTADKAIKVEVDTFTRSIKFSDGLGNGNKVTISSATGDIADVPGVDEGSDMIRVVDPVARKVPTYDYLGNKELSVSLNGVTKKISMAKVIDQSGELTNEEFVSAMQKELDNAFGAGKITAARSEDGKLSFTPSKEGEMLSVSGSAAKALGFTSGGSNYINTGDKLTDLLGDRADSFFSPENRLKAVGSVDTAKMVDSAGNKVKKAEDGSYYRVNNDGKALYDFKVNGANITVTEDTTLESLMNSINSNAEAGVKVSYSKLTNEFKFTATETGANSKIEFGGLAKDLFVTHDRSAGDSFSETYGLGLAEGESKRFTFDFGGYKYKFDIKDTDSVEDVINKLNKSPALSMHGNTASFDELSGQFVITDNATGKTVDYKLLEGNGEEGAYEYETPKFESSYTRGQDAILDVEVNGKRFENLVRSSNNVDIDGLNMTLKGTFETGADEEAVTFETTTDADKIVEAIASMINDYNEMATEIKNAYSTQPAYKSKNQRYEPLTAEQEDQYSESELKAYNEKAKQGILFGDSNMSSMYSKLLSSITPGGAEGQALREIGITTSYSNGMTTLTLDEDKLRSALDSNPDKVKNAFTKTVEGGSSRDGLMKSLQNTLDAYTKTVGEPKGLLINHAGSVKAPTSLNSNTLQTQMNNFDKQIDRWQDKMADQIDRYTTKFSKLEQLIAEMNSQSSALMGLMGGGGSY